MDTVTRAKRYAIQNKKRGATGTESFFVDGKRFNLTPRQVRRMEKMDRRTLNAEWNKKQEARKVVDGLIGIARG